MAMSNKEFTKEPEEISLDGFWTALEFRLSRLLEMTDDPELKGFWCDGIYLPTTNQQLRKKYVNDKRKIQLKAWLGKTGQEVYDATVHFGKKAQSLYVRDLPLVNSIPTEEENSDWFTIDVRNRVIEIYLN